MSNLWFCLLWTVQIAIFMLVFVENNLYQVLYLYHGLYGSTSRCISYWSSLWESVFRPPTAGWFGIVKTALVTSTKLGPLSTGIGNNTTFGGSTVVEFTRVRPTCPWVGAVNTGDDFGRSWGRNGEFCVTVGPVTRLLAYSILFYSKTSRLGRRKQGRI